MNLIGFHRLLIVVGIAFCLGFSGWQLNDWVRDGETAALLLAAVFTVLGLALTVYLMRLKSILKLDEPSRD